MHLKINIRDKNSAQVTIPMSHIWFSDHIVDGHKMLPGVAHLSLIWSVAEKLFPNQTFQGFENINWVNPIICVSEAVSLYTEIVPMGSSIDYTITDNAQQLCSTGTLLTASLVGFQPVALKIPSCKVVYTTQDLYSSFEKSGILYGPFFRGLDKVQIAHAQSCYAEITLRRWLDTLKSNLLDNAFQSLLGLSMADLSTPLLPFSIGKMVWHPDYHALPIGRFYVCMEKISDIRVNVTIFDAQQRSIMSIYDLGIRPLIRKDSSKDDQQKSKSQQLPLTIGWEPLTFIPKWQITPLEVEEPLDKAYIFISFSLEDQWIQSFMTYIPTAQTIVINQLDCIQQLETLWGDTTIAHEFWFIDAATHIDTDAIYRKTFYFIECLKWLSRYRTLSIKVISKLGLTLDPFNPSIHPQNTSLLGLAQTAAKEFNFPIIPISTDVIDAQHIKLICDENNSANPNKDPILIKQGKRYLRQLVTSILPTPQASKFRKQGNYLIIGGLGGLGKVLAAYLMQNYSAHVVLMGRSKQVQLDSLQGLGGTVVYESVDLLDAPQLEQVIRKYPTIHGIVHSALVLQDKTIQFMDYKTLYTVLDPKVKGGINLLNILVKYNIPLDFILFFSSIQSFIANPGQANYIAACLFKDALAMLLRNTYMYETKVINWGYWGNVGIVSTTAYRARMTKLGIGSIEAEEGIRIIEALLASDWPQVAVLKASREALDRLHIKIESSSDVDVKIESSLDDAEALLQAIVPTYNPNDPRVVQHQKAQEALEIYSRYAIRQIKLPEVVVDKYIRLKTAITHMASVAHFDKAAMLKQFPWLQGHVRLLDRCLQHYPQLLTAAIDHMSVLFPDGKSDLVEPIYRDNPTADYFNDLISKVVANYLKWCKHSGSIQIIEIGAGTGSTTACILPILDTSISYYFTDLSYAFLHKAKATFNAFPNVIYQRYDVEQPPMESWIHQFDLVIATNVLHATSAIRNTLTHVRMLLKDKGIILLNETTAKLDYATLTFGLTPGWWLFQDYRIEDSPLLDGSTWFSLLKKSGFKATRAHGGTTQQVIVAVADKASLVNRNDLYVPPMLEPTSVFQADREQNREDSITAKLVVKNRAQALKNFIIDAIATIMKMPPEDIKPDTVFATYGIDSLITLELLKPFKHKFGYIPSTILFEYPTINKLTQYFLENHQTQLEQLFPIEAEEEEHSERTPTVPSAAQTFPLPIRHFQEGVIAIIGMAGLLPQAQNCQEFWYNLLQAKNCIETIPRERWDSQSFYDAEGSLGMMYTTYGGFIQDVACFDHTFFGITPYDAENMDPQERLFLQTSYHAIEDAGYPLSKLAGTATGVFVGVMNGPYALVGLDAVSVNWADSLYWSIANRLSYTFDWSGPSMAIDTACSSSLTALHIACKAIQSGDCPVAIVGGTNLILHPRQYTKLCKVHMLASGNQCKSFGAQADGFVDGEGIIAMVLKKYRTAIQDQDRIYGIIQGTTVNAGGKSNGYNAPNPNAQAALVRNMLEKETISAESISYVEAHGTGTALGDPVELNGLIKAFHTTHKQYCALGSVKSNIGHLESAAGLAGVMKVLLQMQHKIIVPSLHAVPANPHLNMEDTPFFLATAKQDWQTTNGMPRRALVNSFGAGGANASIILEEAPIKEAIHSDYSLVYYLIPLSAQSLSALQGQLDAFRVWLKDSDHSLYAIAYTLACARDHYTYRICFVVSDRNELLHHLSQTLLELNKANISNRPTNLNGLDYHYELLSTMETTQLKNIFAQIAAAYQAATPIKWENIYRYDQRIPMPTYAFDKHMHWIERPKYGLDKEKRYLYHHQIEGQPIVPVSLSLSKMLETASDSPIYSLENVYWLKPIVSFDEIHPIPITPHKCVLQSSQGTIYCKGTIGSSVLPPRQEVLDNFWKASLDFDIIEHKVIYAQFSQMGYQYGPTYQKLRFVRRSSRTAVGAIEGTLFNTPLVINPSTLEAGLQLAMMPLMVQANLKDQKICLPFYLKKLNLYSTKLDDLIYCYCMLQDVVTHTDAITYSLYFVNVYNEILLSFEDMVSKIVDSSKLTIPDLSWDHSPSNSYLDPIEGVKIYKLNKKT